MTRRLILVVAWIGWCASVSAQIVNVSPQTISVQDSSTECSVAGTCANWQLPNTSPSFTLQVSGTFSATLTVKASADCQTFTAINMVRLSSGAQASTITAAGQYAIANSGLSCLRVVGTTVASGGANMSLARGSASSVSKVNTPSGGGTGIAAAPTDGQLLIGKSSDNSFNLATLTAGSNVTITNGAGSITIAAASGSAGCALTYTAKTGTYGAAANDLVAATSGTFTVTLPAASTNANKCIGIVNNGTGTLTIAGTGVDTVALGSTDTLNPRVSASIQGDSGVYWSDGISNWNKM